MNALDQAWEAINGMVDDPQARNLSSYEEGYRDAIDEALAIIERLGGQDPTAAKERPASYWRWP